MVALLQKFLHFENEMFLQYCWFDTLRRRLPTSMQAQSEGKQQVNDNDDK